MNQCEQRIGNVFFPIFRTNFFPSLYYLIKLSHDHPQHCGYHTPALSWNQQCPLKLSISNIKKSSDHKCRREFILLSFFVIPFWQLIILLFQLHCCAPSTDQWIFQSTESFTGCCHKCPFLHSNMKQLPRAQVCSNPTRISYSNCVPDRREVSVAI